MKKRKIVKESVTDREIRLEFERRAAVKFARDSARSKKGWVTRRKRGYKVSKATRKKISLALKRLYKAIKLRFDVQHQRRVKAARKAARTRKRNRKILFDKLKRRNEILEGAYGELEKLRKNNLPMFDFHHEIVKFLNEADPLMIDDDRARQCQIEFGLPNIGDVYDIWWSPGKPSKHSGV